MNNETFEQFSLSKAQIGEKMGYIKEGMDTDIVVFNNKPISIDVPIKIDLKVSQTPEGVRGDTAQGSVTKEATLETGQIVKVPLFIKKGDVVRVNTETGKYVERVK
jgi:elongation factor P